MSLECVLPSKEFLSRELVATTGFFQRDLAGPHSGEDRGLAADRPSFAVWRRQLGAHRFPSERATRGPSPEREVGHPLFRMSATHVDRRTRRFHIAPLPFRGQAVVRI